MGRPRAGHHLQNNQQQNREKVTVSDKRRRRVGLMLAEAPPHQARFPRSARPVHCQGVRPDKHAQGQSAQGDACCPEVIVSLLPKAPLLLSPREASFAKAQITQCA